MSLTTIRNKGGNQNHLELASSLVTNEKIPNVNYINDIPIQLEDIKKLINNNTTIYVCAMPNKIGDGDVASNFRYKHDQYINNIVVDNWIEILNFYNNVKAPVVITIPGRKSRIYTLKMLDNGSIQIVNNFNKSNDSEKTSIFQNFLDSYMTREYMMRVREASKGARYNSYLADMIGFLNMINWNFNRSIFRYESLEPLKVNTNIVYDRNKEGKKILQPIQNGSTTWIPKDDFNYLYFKNQDKIPEGHMYAIVNDNNMSFVYNQLFEAIDNNENNTKKNIRQFLTEMESYSRHSDYWVNDVDDGFTLLMILNCFKYVKLNKNEKNVHEQLNKIYEEVF